MSSPTALNGNRPEGRRRISRVLVGAVALATAISTTGTALALPAPASATNPNFGPNVKIFDPSMPQSDIQATVDAIAALQIPNEMGTERYALLFKPGTYGSDANPLDIPVGYYTEVAGLGQNPGDVTINGGVTATGRNGSGSLDTFWRSVSNLTIHVVPTADGCHTGNEMWAVSQAAPMRRVDVKEFTTFMPYCENPNFASGGFVADSFLEGGALNGSQQQFYVRNSDLGNGWSNYVWNQVFSGDLHAPAQDFGRDTNPGTSAYTTLVTTPVSKERPYLYVNDKGDFRVFVPSAQTNSVGTTWANGPTPGTSLPLSSFFLVTASTTAAQAQNALDSGKNLLVTPGVYTYDRTLTVNRSNTVVLGLGLATFTAKNGNTILQTNNNAEGVDIAGLTFDAGLVNSPVLVKIGTGKGAHKGSASNPTALQDVFFRIGGPHVGKATVSLEVNQDNVILDDIWAWRADHGVAGSVGWTINTADTGVVVNGDNVTATGLFVEHYQKYNVIWNGEGGQTIFFQNELPYDAPNQAAYQHDGILGYAAFKIANDVKTFQGYGMGSYIYTPVDPTIHVSHSFEAPVTPGVQLHDILTLNLSGPGTIDHVVNDIGGPANDANRDTIVFVVSFP
ncbi:MAG: hypothetical protein QOG52_1983 [Frankiaceae bacterium]|nr:hypothetical protein [Frankiaceae bacterium]